VTETYHLFQKGRRQLADGMPAQATVSLEKAKRREPRKASIREALGIAYFRLQRYAEAESEFRALLELSPADDYGRYALGRTLDKLGRADEAQAQYKLARALKPTSKQYQARVRELG
jgi:Flp pilus assembly protein TadD